MENIVDVRAGVGSPVAWDVVPSNLKTLEGGGSTKKDNYPRSATDVINRWTELPLRQSPRLTELGPRKQ